LQGEWELVSGLSRFEGSGGEVTDRRGPEATNLPGIEERGSAMDGCEDHFPSSCFFFAGTFFTSSATWWNCSLSFFSFE
jgi:hypothetical protein